MKVYSNILEIEQEPSLIGYIRPLQRAWAEFSLSSVLCVNGTPLLYRKDSTQILSEIELKELHRLFWNQGIAGVFLVTDPRTAYIFSGFVSPLSENENLDAVHTPLVMQGPTESLLHDAINTLYESVGNGEFYRRYSNKFKAGTSVDEYLTANLRTLQNLLTSKNQTKALSEDSTHNFICRLLFACYLVDRGIVQLPTTTQQHLHEVLIERADEDALNYLYRFFKSLKSKFNGSMFDQDLDDEREQITPDHMSQIKAFLRGDKLGSNQQSLGFWAYDFKLIPVETISGIYENFLGWEDKKKKGAYYTPRFLAEMTLDAASGNQTHWTKLRYLDPCCGSGIFLVALFNRLATAWELSSRQLETKGNYYELKAEALLDILRTQIRGMDQKESACKLACFSLYVALLDSFNPSDIKTYIEVTGHKLPKLFLSKDGRMQNGDHFIPVICEGDTLTSTRFELASFDVAIGNPPWSDRGQKQMALQFLMRMDDLLKSNGTACLLLPSKIFLNISTDEFQAQWLETHTLERVIQLADFRKILFPEASCPCMVVRYRQGKPGDMRHMVLYDTPKFNASARRQGLVAITEVDRKNIPQAKIAWLAQQEKAHTYWKRLLWGTPRDQRLLEYFEQFPKLEDRTGGAKSTKPWKKGQGIQPDSKNRLSENITTDIAQNSSRYQAKFPWWQPDHLFIDATADCLKSEFHLFQSDAEPVGDKFKQLYFSREDNQLIFQPPLVLISQGFNKVVFCDFPVLYQHSLQGIHGPAEDKNLLLFLTAYIHSDIAKYFCFHTSSTLGIERDVVRFDELLKLPFPLPDLAPAAKAKEIIEQVANLMLEEQRHLLTARKEYDEESWLISRKERAHKLQQETNELVYRYFDLSDMERYLVEDTINVFLPSTTPSNANVTNLPTMLSIENEETKKLPNYQNGLSDYAKTLTCTLNKWAQEQNSNWHLQASGGVDELAGLAFVELKLEHTAANFKPLSSNSKVWKSIFESFVHQQVILRHERQIFYFEGKNLRIIRPISLSHWTHTAALNDADEIFAQIQMMKGRLQ